MESKKHIIIFSHGFGVTKDSRGLFTSIVETFPECECILFDYNEIDEEKKQITVKTFTEQVAILENIINQTKLTNPCAIIDIIAHSQGAIIVALAKPTGIRKTILMAPSYHSNIDRMISIFGSRPGTEINFDGISKFARKDGSVTLIPPEYWIERKAVDPIDLYNQFASQTKLLVINASEDEVLGEVDFSKLRNIEVITVEGGHNFEGEYQDGLKNVLASKLTI